MAENDSNPSETSVEQVEVRKQKLAKLKAAGSVVYPNDFKPTHTASEIVDKFTGASDEELAGAPKNLHIAGRIMALRRMGKASFFHLQDRRGRLQIYIQQNSV
ncbi:MAG TPA: OB-fold nucleic acid binding domain-containing protein, partial [Candidatus Binatia bacterium]|nr:OB-fold nucleic acid binding domain-containing protein [Candidatus Binatia bacterium]